MQQRTPRIHIHTLGCPKNEVDSDRMRAAVVSSAYEAVGDPDDADVAVVNTCAFVQEATEESLAAVLEFAQGWKDEMPSRTLIVTGCMPSRYGGDLVRELPEVDAFVPVSEEHRLLEVLERTTGHPAMATPGPSRTVEGVSAYLQISDGCHRRCTYCTIPVIRGPYRSRPLSDLLDEGRVLVDSGAREIVLVGQDTSAYGRDLGDDATVSDVLRSLADIDGLEWLRLMYVQPDGVTDELLEAMAALPPVRGYLDLPLQHASRDVLRRMGRTGDGESYLRLLTRIREALPEMSVRTSLIAGFPGETEADVSELESFLREAALDHAGVFAYSPEEGTPAATMPDGLPDGERLDRANSLRALADEIGMAKTASRVGETVEVLVEGVDEEGVPVGRWSGQAPDVDGVVTFDAAAPAGTLLRVRLTGSFGYDLVGEVED